MTIEKRRASYLTVSQQFDLDHACKALEEAGLQSYHVGSSITRPDWRDVDVRCIMDDDEFDALFLGARSRLKFLNVAISEWLGARTGLPVDFQFQRMTEANAEFNGPRSAIGMSSETRTSRRRTRG